MQGLAEHIDSLFAEGGHLCSREDFEYRPQQRAMANAVVQALNDSSHLLVEAPTGVGKTLAYLLPLMLFTKRTHKRAIISTHTKNLQDQLLLKDLPLAEGVLGITVNAMALKGRRNYLCTTRLRAAYASAGSLFEDNVQHELDRILQWSLHTSDGDVSSLGFVPRSDVWDAVCSEPGTCNAIACRNDCFYQRIKERARSADILVMNHALVFSHLALSHDEEESIVAADSLLFDEAHTLEAVAANTLGKSVSRRQLLSIVRRLYSGTTKRGLLADQSRRTKTLCKHAEEAIDTFFESVRRAMLSSVAGDPGAFDTREVRVRQHHLVANTLDAPLSDLQATLERAADATDAAGQSQEIKIVHETLEQSRLFVEEFLHAHDDDTTYWAELAIPPRDNVSLKAAPIHMGRILGPKIFAPAVPVIMTSATLSVNGSLEFFRERVGAVSASTLTLDSPFDFQRQMRVFIRRDMPEPDSPAYSSALPHHIVEAVARSDGRALVLFTSAQLLRSVAAIVREQLEDQGISLLVQGIDLERHLLLEEFKRDIRSVLFGLDSFWMGIDVPGEALAHVIITRLPFSVPSHPLVEARMEDIAARGGHPFAEYALPEAVLKFRQGVGRLIRTRTDKGLVTILDSRVLSKSYGRVFLAALPSCVVEAELDGGETTIISRGGDS